MTGNSGDEIRRKQRLSKGRKRCQQAIEGYVIFHYNILLSEKESLGRARCRIISVTLAGGFFSSFFFLDFLFFSSFLLTYSTQQFMSERNDKKCTQH